MNTTTTYNKIEDFGRKIGGARKDYAAEAKANAEKFANAANPDALKGCKTLGALVKLPNLEALAKAGAIYENSARAALIIWRGIDRKPSTSWRAATWATKTAPKLARIAELLGGAAVYSGEANGAEFRTLAAAGWPAEPFSFGAYTVRYSNYSYYSNDAQTGSGPLRAIQGGRYVATCATPEEMAVTLRALVERDGAERAKGPALATSMNRAGRYYIHPEHNANISIYVMPAGATSYEVRNYMKEHRAELVERLHALQQFPALRRKWNRPRVGTDWRKDHNVTPEDFAAGIPFYGVEFGNWVNQTERANLLNLAFDGFHDLAQLWGIAPEACALGGSLAFAFGARGHSAAMAHYEPGRKVINLTKKNGAGCMAHEWLHAVDNWVMYRQGLDGYASEANSTAASEAEHAGAALLQVIKNTEFYKRSANLAEYKGDYWITGRELAARGFEGVCAFLMRVNGVCSDFLVNCVSMDEFTAQDVEHRSDFYPYPTEAEAATLAPYYFAFLRAAFGDCVQMSEAVRANVEELAQVAAREQVETEAKRKADAEELAQQRAEIEAAAQSHAEAVAEENRVDMEKRTAEVMAETGAEWSHVFRSGARYYAVGGGRGFVFLIYSNGKTAYRLTVENNRIKKAFRGAHRYYIEHRRGVDLAAAIREDVRHGFTGVSLMFDVFSHTTAATWEEFCAKHGAELTEIRKKSEAQAREAEKGEKVAQNAPTAAPVSDALAKRAEGLALVAIAGGVAVVETRQGATYKARKEIRANGGDWNREAKQWQATTAEDVARLRAWFGMAETVEEQAPTDAAAEVKTCAPTLYDAGEIIENADSETAAPSCDVVAEVVEDSEGLVKESKKEPEQSAARWGVFSFSDADLPGVKYEIKCSFDTEVEALAQMEKNRTGRGWVNPEAVENLCNGGNYWHIRFAKTGGVYVCDFVAEVFPCIGDRAQFRADEMNLHNRFNEAKRKHLAARYSNELKRMKAGDVFRMDYEGDAVTVTPDTSNTGRYVVAWWQGDDKREQHTNRTPEDAADTVAGFAVHSVPVETLRRWRCRDFITRYRASEKSQKIEAAETKEIFLCDKPNKIVCSLATGRIKRGNKKKKISFTIKHTELITPPRCRKPRLQECESKVTAIIREVSAEQAPIAFIVKEYDRKARNVRLYDGKLWRQIQDRRKEEGGLEGNSPLWVNTVINENKWKDFLISNNYGTYNSIGKYWDYGTIIEKKLDLDAKSKCHLIVDGEAYERTGEPFYNVLCFGLGGNHGGTGFFVKWADFRDRGCLYGWSASDKQKAIDKAVAIALERGDTKSEEHIRNTPYDILVLIPKAIRRRYDRELND